MSLAFTPNRLRIHHPQRLYSLPVAGNRLLLLNFRNPPLPNALRFASDERKPRLPIRAFASGGSTGGGSHREVSDELSLDILLSVTEILLIIPPAIYAIGSVVSFLIPNAVKPLGSKIFAWQFLSLVGFVAVGSFIRRRQWGRVYREKENWTAVDLLARIEKAEEDLRSSATIVGVLSRKREKLGITFRVTRKALKEPLTETAALAQKNHEAIYALKVQDDILEKELGEIQKVLMAMQEQQQKQLDLILAISKASKLLESKHVSKQTTGDPNTKTRQSQQ